MDRIIFTSLIVAALVAVNLYGSYCVMRAKIYNTLQKVAQLSLIWLLPVIGIFLVYTFLKESIAFVPSDSGGTIGDMGPIDLLATNPDIVNGSDAGDADS